MGKYDHIPELTGADNYIPWETQVQLVLTNDDLWCHVTKTVDPNDILGTASVLPVAAIPASSTDAKKTAIRTWLINDSKAKTIILCKLAPSIHLLIPRNTAITSHEAWKILRDHFHRNDVSSQFVIRRRIQALRMKDASEANNYIGLHISYHDRLIGMGAAYSDEEAVFNLPTGSPSSPAWQLFHTQLEQRMHNSFSATIVSSSISSGAPILASFQTNSITFDSCTSRISSEATRMLNVQPTVIPGPGSKYANTVTTSTSNVNPITGLRKHRNNPQGVFCLTTGYGHGDHNKDHCFREGGGMAGQAPWQKRKKETAVVAANASAPTSSPSSNQPQVPIAALITHSTEPTANHRRDLSCAIIEELPNDSFVISDISAQANALSTILDSGTTSMLICDHAMFWTYSTQDPVIVKTANHGSLPTSGHSDCVAWLKIGGAHHRVRLSNCLHAPGAMLNLLSVGWMLAKGWECNFCGEPAHCELVYRGETLGVLPMSGRLFYVDLKFIPPDQPVPLVHEVSAFTHTPLTYDIWHARMGHMGGESVRRLPHITQGFSLDSNEAMSRCESCIIGKHPCQPHPSSESPPASHFLELIHSDVCGPFPVETPHHKRYFIIFLDDHTGILDLQLLATKDQALDAWRTVRA